MADRQGSQGSGSSAFEGWDDVFADSDPTRVLPADAGEGAGQAGSSSAGAGISATRYQASAPAQVTSAEKPMAEPAPAKAAWSRPASPAPEVGPVDPSLAYRRVQFIPAFIAALAAYSVAKGLVYGGMVLAGLFKFKTYETPGALAAALFDAAARPQALPWAIVLAVAYFGAFVVAGYAAARMSAIAPLKQAMGVNLVALLVLLLASLLAWVSSMSGLNLTPTYSLGYFLADGVGNGLLALLAFFALAMTGALVGSGVGSRYHRKLRRQTR